MQTYIQQVGPTAQWFAQHAGSTVVLAQAVAPVTVSFLREQRVIGVVSNITQGARHRPEGGFDGLLIESDTVQDVGIQVARGDMTQAEKTVEVGNVSALAAAIDALLRATALPVSNDRGSPGNLMHVTAVTASDTPAVSVTVSAPVAVGGAGAVIVAADADRRELRLINHGPDVVAIGPPGMTWAQRVIELDAGDVLVENRAANLAWSAITDAGNAASVGVQEVLT